MKPSHFTTPRTMNEFHWTPGYQSQSYKDESIGEIIAGYVLATVIAVGMAALLVAFWSA